MLIEQLPEYVDCVPCPTKELFKAVEVPSALCECPPEQTPYFPAPKRHRITVEEDCFKAMLLNMTNQYHCENPPKGCV